jgi:hypothetical protein
MDREPLGWSVRRHVVDVTFRELELPRPRSAHPYLVLGPSSPTDVIEPDFGNEFGQDFGERRARSSVSAGGPSPAP